MSDDFDLLAELGLEAKPYELKERPEYQVLVLEAGFINSIDTLKAEVIERVKASPKPTVIRFMSDDYKREDIALKLREVAAEVGAVVHKVRVIPGKQLPQTLAQFGAADLRNAIELVDVCTPEQIPPDFLDIFKDATVTSMAGQTNLETKVVHQEVGTSNHVQTNTGFASMIKIEGASVEGAAIVTMNEETLLKIMSTVLGAPQTSANEAVTNGVAELVNLVCGRAKGTLNELGYDVKLASLPVTKDSPEFSQAMARMQNGQAAKITFQTPEGEFALELRFAPRKGASA